MWFTIIIGIVIAYYAFHQLDKRLHRLEEVRGPGYSHWFSVNAIDAVIKHKKFGEITGIKSASEGKEFKDWPKADKDKWFKLYAEKATNRSYVLFNYLASENAYFVKTFKTNSPPSIIHRDGTSNLLYSATIIGNDDGFEPHIELLVYERLVKGAQGKYEWVLVPCLQYRDEHIHSEKHEFSILCEFPHFREQREDEELKQLGFKVERSGGDDVYKDAFGQMQSISTEITYEKNDVEIRYVY